MGETGEILGKAGQMIVEKKIIQTRVNRTLINLTKIVNKKRLISLKKVKNKLISKIKLKKSKIR